MKDQLESQNYDGLRGTAHALKPQITYMGIKGGEDLIKGIENLAGTKSNVEKLPKCSETFKRYALRQWKNLSRKLLNHLFCIKKCLKNAKILIFR
jgi:hypothetical protein